MKKITFLIVLLALFFSWYGTAQITSYPYSEDFEAGAGGWVATNGSNGTWALGAPTASVINSAASGANAWATNLSGNYNNDENSFVQSPEFDLSGLAAPSIQFSIWWNAEFSWDGMVLQSSIDAGSTWQNVGAFGDPNNWYTDNTINGNPGGQQEGWSGRTSSSNGSNGWVIARHALAGLAGQSSVFLRFAFGSDGSVQDNGFAFDSISVFEVTCPEPSGLIVDSQTDTTANISWTPGGSETGWEVSVQPSGTGIPSGPGDPTMTNTGYVAMGLTPATNYEIYVRSSCGTEFSPWIGAANFITECVTFTAPYSEGFENAGTIPVCWNMSGGEDWQFSNTGAGNHIGDDGTITGNTASNGYFAWVDSSGTSAPATLLSPLVDVSGLTTPALSFYEISNNEGNANSTLTVDVWDGATWNNVGIYNTNTSGWELRIIDLGALTITGDIQVRFVFSETVPGDFYDDIAIDDVRLDEAPSCIIPSNLVASNITGTTADVSWSAGTATAWEYVIQAPGTGVPSGNGTALTVNSVNETGLDFSTTYEVYVRTDCGANGFSDWVGPLTFTTTIQTDFTVDCNAGPVNSVSCYDSDDGIGQIITFTSSDGVTPLNITFNGGTVEDGFDALVVLDSDGTTNLNAGTPYGNAGNLAGINYQSTGATISFYVEADFIISCQSSTTFNPIDVTVTCATCVNPTATYAVRGDCFTGPQFFVDVDITSLGSANSLTVTDDQGSAPQTVTATGIISFGPFPNTTDVQITVANDDDINCVRTSNTLTQPFCLDTLVDCNVGPVSVNYCYENSDSNVFSYVSSDGSPLNLTINSGEIEGSPFDFLVILDSDGVTELYNGEGNNGIITGLTFQSTGDTIYFSVQSDTSVSCSSGSFPDGIDYTVACATCINPSATYTVIDDCANGSQFLIDVNITSLGDASSLTITDNQASPGVQVTSTGIVQFGPYPFLTPIVITVSNDQDVNCVINSSPIELLACPPANDNCDGAIVATVNPDESCNVVTPGTLVEATPSGVPNGSCPGNPDDDVWFQFTALGEQQIISLQNLTGGSTNVDHGLYEGTCESLVEIYCSGDVTSLTPSLTIGNTYYIRVFSGGGIAATTTFNLCINTLGPPTYCLDALPICADGGLVYPSVVGDDEAPSYIDYDCLGSVPDPTWNSIYFDVPGNYTFTLAQTGLDGLGNDIDFIVWGPFNNQQDGCYDLVPSSIADCSYSFVSIETVTLNNVQAGDVYVILITNFSQEEGTYTFTQETGPTNGTNCEIVCDVVIEYQGSPVIEDVTNTGFGEPIQLCGETSIELAANSPYANFYEWYLNGFAIPDSNSETITATESGIYQVIANGDVCEDLAFSLQVQVTLGIEPVANSIDDIITCDDVSGDGFEDFDLESQTVVILGSQDPSLFNVTYHLSQTDAITNTGALISPYTNISSPQTIWVRIEDANAPYCIATTSFDLVISGIEPMANASPNLSGCDTDDNGVAEYNLTENESAIVGTQTGLIVTYYDTMVDADAGTAVIGTPTDYETSLLTIYVRVEDMATSCYSVTSFDLVPGELPITTFTSDFDYQVCPNATVPIIITAIPQNYAATDVSIVWYQDGGVISGENGLTLPVLTSGLYEIEVTFNETGCVNSTSQDIIELESCVIPQGISPNGDLLNDTFDLSNFGVTRIEIYNRLGTLVYSRDNYTDEWHGQSDNGDELPVGTYFYTMTYEGGAKTKSAWVYLNK